MPHPLDNPIWQALNTGNNSLAFGTEDIKVLKRDVGIFVGLRNNDEANFVRLHNLLPPQSKVVLFTPHEINIPTNWHVALKKPLLQMVHEPMKNLPDAGIANIVPLGEPDIPAMLDLTAITNPGPFLSRTIDFGNYEGIFENNTLVAMAGQRLQPHPYTEVSAVCTHPEHTGKGYAANLVMRQIKKIVAIGRIPFLHVYPENVSACRVYQKLNFKTRTQLIVYVLQKKAA